MRAALRHEDRMGRRDTNTRKQDRALWGCPRDCRCCWEQSHGACRDRDPRHNEFRSSPQTPNSQDENPSLRVREDLKGAQSSVHLIPRTIAVMPLLRRDSGLPSLGASSPSGVARTRNKARKWKPILRGISCHAADQLLPASSTLR